MNSSAEGDDDGHYCPPAVGPFRHSLVAFLILLLVSAACTARVDAAPPEPSGSQPTIATTTTSQPTTTTTPASPAPLTVRGVPYDLARLVESIYEHAAGLNSSSVDPVYLPEAGSVPGMTGRTAAGGVAEFAGARIGLIRAGSDLIAAVSDGAGWEVVAVDLPSLGHRALGYDSQVIAVVGSDARSGEDPLTARADSLHLVGFDGVAATFDVVGIPRDSWVSIPGRGAGKVNSALAAGGPELLTATLEGVTGFPLAGMAVTGFDGFQEILGNVLGGVQISLPQALRDAASGADFPAGEQYMNGPDALAFARARKTLPRGDLDRQRNGGLVLLATAATARFRPVEELPQMLAAAEQWLWTDLTPTDLLRVAMTCLVAPLLEVDNEVLPGVTGWRGSASVVELSAGAAPLLADLADGSLAR